MNGIIKSRRFWDSVRITHDDQGYQILLDERPVKLPKKTTLYVQSESLAKKIAAEWEKAGEKKGDPFSFDLLPITRIVGTMIEKIAPARETYIHALLPYVNGDLLCYHTDTPKTLATRQQEQWMPLVQWTEERFNIKLKIQHGIMPITQTEEVIAFFKDYLSNLNDTELTYFAVTVPLLGSIFLTIALKEGRLSVEQAFEAAHLDEIVQAELWGQDTEQQEKLAQVKIDIQDAFEFYSISQNK
ncbi:hypothetical protein CIN_07800 [Commensalibacter intestini A911]|uniref:ATP synthase F1 n=2 Tax=Commensalibacter intestini TaxID=479936 RepID=A0A251ZXL1_9PROT|nr:ATP12 family protein [Commensalibacter intestini]EHD14848.1 hypothetical protein CIN_07800 [Commensalibacter intestini A911]OUI79383.1 hypothetical protein HK18_02140 [Commensalibacter intestini]